MTTIASGDTHVIEVSAKDGRRSDYRAHYWLHFSDDTLVAEKGW